MISHCAELSSSIAIVIIVNVKRNYIIYEICLLHNVETIKTIGVIVVAAGANTGRQS